MIQSLNEVFPMNDRFRFHISSKGKLCGVISHSMNRYRITIIVQPKVWNSSSIRNLEFLWKTDTKHLVIDTYENTSLQIHTTNPQQSHVLDSLTDRGRVNLDGSRDFLIERTNPTWSPEIQTTPPFHQHYDPLMALCLLYNKSKNQQEELIFERTSHNPILEAFMKKRFVDETAGVVKYLKSNYIKTTERTRSIRGSITSKGMLQFAATNSVNLECEFEEFTTNVPLYRVIISALHLVKNTPDTELTQNWNLQNEAHSILSQLNHIPPLHPKIALNTARAIRLNRLERKRWRLPLELAVAVLEQKSMIVGERPQEKGYVWHINTATDIWEHLLYNSANTVLNRHHNDAFCLTPKQQRLNLNVKTFNPWHRIEAERDISRTSPDLLLFDGHRLICWDAKYKQTNVPSRPDQYQIFSYSHLLQYSSKNQTIPVSHVGLVYPSESPTISLDHQRGPFENEGNAYSEGIPDTQASPVVLNILKMPFPMPQHLINEDQWNSYLNKLSEAIGNALFPTRDR
jgi:5-methylcytosine-specific restriction endonuclease McrBC regulatory subunit McrC